ncbi:MAG: NAD(P)/FAD-dependent oxidoreductase [Bacilli bacterium]|nr:NAD(P)/FAD-dependent oxidoreductase [Bacilli bacterium]
MSYQAIVIGAGLGGLSAALALQQKGVQTLLLEKHNLPGGCATSFKRGRFEFEGSLHEFCAFGEPGNYGYAGKLINETYGLGIPVAISPDLFRAVLVSRDGTPFDVTLPRGEEAFIQALSQAVPGSEKGLREFISLCKEAYEVSAYFDEHMFEKQKKNGDVKIDAFYFAKHYLRYLQVAEVPFNEVLRKIGVPENAIDILGCYRVYLGVDPAVVSFAHLATMIYSYIHFGPALVLPNSHGFASAFVEEFKRLGGTAYFGVEAKEVVADEQGHIQGVQTDHGFFAAEEVIANVYPEVAYRDLLSKNIILPAREKKRIGLAKTAIRFVNVFLGLNRSVEDFGIHDYTLFFPGDLSKERKQETPLDYCDAAATAYNVLNPDISPKGTAIITLTLEYQDDVWGNVDPADYFKTKEAVAKKAIADYEQTTGISIAPYIEEIEIATPWTYARYLGSPEGTPYGYRFDETNTILTQLLSIRRDQPVPGFYTVGASGPRGDGYSQTTGNGRDIAELVYEHLQGGKHHG